MTDHEKLLIDLARQCKVTVDAIHTRKGKARDSAVIDFWIGAASALKLTAHTSATGVEMFVVMALVHRGYSENERLAAKKET